MSKETFPLCNHSKLILLDCVPVMIKMLHVFYQQQNLGQRFGR